MSGHVEVVAHEATRTGSPRVLLELLRYVAPRLSHPLTVKLLSGGPLSDRLLSVSAPVDPASRPVLVMVNGAAAAHLLTEVAAGVPTLAYVHEEGEALARLPEVDRLALAESATAVLCVSETARRDLEDLGVAADRLTRLPPVVSAASAISDEDLGAARDLLGSRDGVPLVVGCGEAGWRKGADLFVDVAARVRRTRDVDFAWIGLRPRQFSRVLDHDCRQLGISEHVRWLGECDRVEPLLAAADALVMTSREDPQPLVPLEAALVGTPTVGFEVGGLADLIRDGGAAGGPYPDTAAVAAALLDVLDRPDEAEALVGRARERIEQTQTVDVIGPRFLAVLQSLAPELGD